MVNSPSSPGFAEASRPPFPIWPTLGAACLVIAAALFALIVVAIPTVIVLGTPRNPGDPGANIIEAAFYIGGGAALVPLLERLSHRSLSALGVRRIDKRGATLAVAALFTMLCLQGVYQLILTAFHQQNHIQAGFEHFGVRTPQAAIMVLINGALIAPIVEELFFRGLIFNALAVRTPVVLAALVSGVLFGLAHGDAILFPVLAVFGMIQALIYRASGNLVVPMIVHAANNAIFLGLMIAIPGFR